MSPDQIFWLALILKMAVTAGFVLIATIAAERMGPVVGAMVATLPVSTGPTYVFLSLDHDPSFLATSALMSAATTPAIAVFSLVYAVLARRHGLLVSLGIAQAVWFTLITLLQSVAWTPRDVFLLNAVGILACFLVARRIPSVPMPRVRIYWYDIALRAGSVALLVALVIGLSFSIGPRWTGPLAVFPIVLSSVAVILQRRVGGPAVATVFANTILGFVGFGGALWTLAVTVVPLGPALALPLALGVSLAWGLSVIGVQRLRQRHA